LRVARFAFALHVRTGAAVKRFITPVSYTNCAPRDFRASGRGAQSAREHDMRTSARNQFIGEVAEVKHGAVNDEVTLRTQDGLEIVAIITHGSATSLGLAAGKKAFALVKASSVIVMVDVAKSQVSARNCFAGTVSAVTKGAVNSEVVIGAGSAQIAAIITNDSVERLGLASGKAATAIFKASSVIVGVDQ
jgi:molybdate transport system regulatory protein